MTLFSLLFVLILEQFKALPAERIRALLATHANALERQFNGGEHQHGTTAWLVGVAVPALLVVAAHWLCVAVNPLLAIAFDAAVLYLTLGFRQFSHYFTDIQMALQLGELDRSRHLLHEWTGRQTDRLGSAEIARLAIEQGILHSHRHVFAPLFWFLILGPGGAVLYRLGEAVAEHWRHAGELPDEPSRFGAFAGRAFQILDGLPARMTAATFAIVGDFEDAVQCWRTQARQWPDAAAGILLASGAGALGIKLGLPLPEALGVELRPELGVGEEADVADLHRATGLLWRALIMCLLLLAALTLANWVGG